jgi:hypothetical protein
MKHPQLISAPRTSFVPDHAIIAKIKHRGISLAEMITANVVVTGSDDTLLRGTMPPNTRHQINRRILQLRDDLATVVYVRIDPVVDYFPPLSNDEFRHRSSALVRQAPTETLPDDVIKIDAFTRPATAGRCPTHALWRSSAPRPGASIGGQPFADEVSPVITAGTVTTAWGRPGQHLHIRDRDHRDLSGGRHVVYGE